MRRTLLLIFIIIIICLFIPIGILFAGDYYNIPLWPINYFNKIIPVDFRCQITDPFPISLDSVSSGNSYVVVNIQDTHQRPIKLFHGEILKTDSNGLLRIYLPEGRYMIRAHLIGVKGERIVKFGTGEPGEYKRIAVSKDNNKILLNLYQLKESDLSQMIARMKKYLNDGYIDQAYTLVMELETVEANTAHDVNLKGEVITNKQNLERIIDLINQLGRLDIDQYNSKIIIYQRILNLVKENLPALDESEIRVIQEDQEVFPLRVIQALESTRNNIIRKHANNIREFINIGKYSKATEEWIYLKNRRELVTRSPYLSNSAAPLIEEARNIIEVGKKQIYDHLAKLYQSALQNYQMGDFEKSREEFNQLYEEYLALRGEFPIDEEVIQTVYSYIRDLTYIDKGLNDFLMNDYWSATESFKSVTHWIDRLQIMVTEMRLPVRRTVPPVKYTPKSDSRVPSGNF